MNAGTLRSGMHIPQGAVFPNMNTPHLLPQQTQAQPGAQPQMQPNPMSMLPNHTNPTQGMSLLGGGAQPNGGVTSPNYNLQLMQAAQTRARPMPHAMTSGLAVPAQQGLNGIPRAMQYQNPLMRTVQPQPQGLTQVGAHGMHQVSQNMAGVSMAALNNMNPAMNTMNNRMRMQQIQQPPIAGGQAGMQPMQADMAMMRPGMQTAAVFGQLAGRPTAAQGHPMPNMQASTPFPPSLQPFVNASMQQHQHQPQPPQLAASPRPPHNAHPGQLPTTLSNQQAAVLQQQQQQHFRRMTPEQQNMLMNPQMTPNLQHAGARIAPAVGAFPFGSAGSPSQMGDVQQGMPNGIMGTPGAQARLRTPAQTLEQLNPEFSMAPPQQMPQRPPSQQRLANAFQIPRQPSVGAHSSPRHVAAALQTQRPQSQPQVQQGSPSQLGRARTCVAGEA